MSLLLKHCQNPLKTLIHVSPIYNLVTANLRFTNPLELKTKPIHVNNAVMDIMVYL